MINLRSFMESGCMGPGFNQHTKHTFLCEFKLSPAFPPGIDTEPQNCTFKYKRNLMNKINE